MIQLQTVEDLKDDEDLNCPPIDNPRFNEDARAIPLNEPRTPEYRNKCPAKSLFTDDDLELISKAFKDIIKFGTKMSLAVIEKRLKYCNGGRKILDKLTKEQVLRRIKCMRYDKQ